MGRDPSEIFHLAAGLWYTERRDLIMSLYTLLRVLLLSFCLYPNFWTCNCVFSCILLIIFFYLQAVVLDQGLEAGLVSDIQRHLEDLINSGLRQRLISLIKVGSL